MIYSRATRALQPPWPSLSVLLLDHLFACCFSAHSPRSTPFTPSPYSIPSLVAFTPPPFSQNLSPCPSPSLSVSLPTLSHNAFSYLLFPSSLLPYVSSRLLLFLPFPSIRPHFLPSSPVPFISPRLLPSISSCLVPLPPFPYIAPTLH